ncbi:hypothetical protein PAXINDRAFT_169601 [Paxillus involutus ATCC 200175]|uniref:Uncharacterized protein n=1 Tax=Paxillus involutus ATCC 200175 TaxID=664439 RepID=A0A0C9U6F7_PAXIN|nr:hypothetical protein PAXINDRAFT_169601 [Paxillus involutus ATCC 200175]
MSSSILEHPALALYSIPAMWALAYFPAFLKNITIGRSVGYDNVTPRGNLARVRDADVAALVKRMDGAHQNGLETLPLWISAVLAGTITHVDTHTMNISAAIFIALRTVYIYVYVTNKTPLQSLLRTALWLGSTGVAMRLLVKAAGTLSS